MGLTALDVTSITRLDVALSRLPAAVTCFPPFRPAGLCQEFSAVLHRRVVGISAALIGVRMGSWIFVYFGPSSRSNMQLHLFCCLSGSSFGHWVVFRLAAASCVCVTEPIAGGRCFVCLFACLGGCTLSLSGFTRHCRLLLAISCFSLRISHVRAALVNERRVIGAWSSDPSCVLLWGILTIASLWPPKYLG